MPDREAFLRTIVEQPEADGPRLVFADWLEEQGDPRGEFIRLQIERLGIPSSERRAGLSRREDELLKLHGEAWRAELPAIKGVTWGVFRRGDVETIEVDTAERFLRYAPRIFAAAPIVNVWFTRLDTAGAELLAQSEHLRRLTLLKNAGAAVGDDGVKAIANSPHAGNLQQLFVNQNNISDDGVRSLAQSRQLRKLWRLFLNENRIGDAGARALADSKRLSQLREVYLAGNAFSEDAKVALRARFGDSAFV